MQETNTFVASRTTIASFAATYIHRGEAMLTGFDRARVEVAGFLDVLRAAGAEIVPLLAAHAGSGGLVVRRDFDTLVEELVARLRQAGRVDGLLLALHGAMAVEDEPDAEAEIISRLRAALPAGTPVGVSLDLHGHVTPAMLQPDTVLIGYREYPHTDMFETGQRTARLLLDMVRSGRRPAMALAKCPMLLSPVAARSDRGALQELLAVARQMEAQGEILHASLFPVQPWLDIPGLGFAALVCADSPAAASKAGRRLADLAWAARTRFEPDLVPLHEAIRIGLSSAGLTVIGDGGDAPSSGAAADHAGVLRALLAAGADRAPRLTYLTLVDEAAVQAAAAAGIGAEVSLHVGHATTRDGEPVRVTGRVRSLTDGCFVMHDAGAQDSPARMGPTAVLCIGSLRLALRSLPGFEWDTGIYTSVGLDLRDAGMVFVKSPSHFRVAYAPHASRIIAADTPGAACGNMRQLVLHRARPLYPLDDIAGPNFGPEQEMFDHAEPQRHFAG
jgi:microcystin degradation protein MlrC